MRKRIALTMKKDSAGAREQVRERALVVTGKPGPMVAAPKAAAPSLEGAFAEALKGKFPGR